MDYSIPKPSLKKTSSDTIWFIAGRDKGLHTFPKDISLKVNIIVQMEFELTLRLQFSTLAIISQELSCFYMNVSNLLCALHVPILFFFHCVQCYCIIGYTNTITRPWWVRMQIDIPLGINFYLLRTFCPHLGSFCVVSSFTTFRTNFTSGRLQVIYRDLG